MIQSMQVFQADSANLLDPANCIFTLSVSCWSLQVYSYLHNLGFSRMCGHVCSWRLHTAERFHPSSMLTLLQFNGQFKYYFNSFLYWTEIIPKVWYWGYWVSPLTYAYNALVVNEMFGSRWMNKFVSFYLWTQRKFNAVNVRKWEYPTAGPWWQKVRLGSAWKLQHLPRWELVLDWCGSTFRIHSPLQHSVRNLACISEP